MRHCLAAMEGILGIAPGATQVAAGQADKRTGQASVTRFALNAFEYFSDLEHEGIIPDRQDGQTNPLLRGVVHMFNPKVNMKIQRENKKIKECQIKY